MMVKQHCNMHVIMTLLNDTLVAAWLMTGHRDIVICTSNYDYLHLPLIVKWTGSLCLRSLFSVLVVWHENFFRFSSVLMLRMCKSPLPIVTTYLPATLIIIQKKHYMIIQQFNFWLQIELPVVHSIQPNRFMCIV